METVEILHSIEFVILLFGRCIKNILFYHGTMTCNIRQNESSGTPSSSWHAAKWSSWADGCFPKSQVDFSSDALMLNLVIKLSSCKESSCIWSFNSFSTLRLFNICFDVPCHQWFPKWPRWTPRVPCETRRRFAWKKWEFTSCKWLVLGIWMECTTRGSTETLPCYSI